MARKSFTFIMLLLCVLLGDAVVFCKEIQSRDKNVNFEEEMLICEVEEGSGGYEVDISGKGEESSTPEDLVPESVHPSLSCMTFKNAGCVIECFVIGQVFNLPTRGSCDGNKTCKCVAIQRSSSVDALWYKKFGFSDILFEIKGNETLLELVRVILTRSPFKAAQEIKDELKPILPKALYNKITLEDYTDAANMIDSNSQLNLTVIKQHVSEILSKTLRFRDIKYLKNLKYTRTFLKAIQKVKNESEEKFLKLYVHIRRTKNLVLNYVLKKYMNMIGTKQSSRDEAIKQHKKPATVAETISDYIINALINLISGQSFTSEKNGTIDKETRISSEDGTPLDENRFKLKKFNKSILPQFDSMNRIWKTDEGMVSYYGDWRTNVHLEWIKNKDKVVIEKLFNKDVRQIWIFKNVHISLFKSPRGDIKQKWNLGTSTFEYVKNTSGYLDFGWTKGKADNELLAKYQKFIDAWCRNNDFLIDNEYCVIYKLGYSIDEIFAPDHLLPIHAFQS